MESDIEVGLNKVFSMSEHMTQYDTFARKSTRLERISTPLLRSYAVLRKAYAERRDFYNKQR